MELSSDQQEAFSRIMESVDNREGKKFYLDGSAGSGKSFLVKYLCKEMGFDNVMLTSTTGVSAQLIGGITIYSASSYNPYRKTFSAEKWIDRLEKKKLLVIDECSMLNVDVFDAIIPYTDQMDITVLFIGDFRQLKSVEAGRDGKEYIFESYFWDCERLNLTHNHRQSDIEFIDVLNDIRNGVESERALEFIDSRMLPVPKGTPRVVPYRKEAERINNKQLKSCDEEIHESEAVVSYSDKWTKAESIFKTSRIPQYFEYCVGARVMFLTNDQEKRWYNGTLGYIQSIRGNEIGIKTDRGFLISVRKQKHEIFDSEGRVKFSFQQYPLMLSWAMTSHKIQGSSLDTLAVNLSNNFCEGMSYVSLSRCTDPKGLYVSGNLKLIQYSDKILDFEAGKYDKKPVKKDMSYAEEEIPF